MTQAPNECIDRIEATLERFAQLTFQNAARYDATLDRHDQALTRLEANANRHDQAITRMEDAITNLTNTVASNNAKTEQAIANLTNTVAQNNTRLTDRLDAIAQQSAAERETMISEIREIWRYLRYQPGNGRSGNQDA